MSTIETSQLIAGICDFYDVDEHEAEGMLSAFIGETDTLPEDEFSGDEYHYSKD